MLSLISCWDRYRDLLNSCPHHGFETWRLVSHFYEWLIHKDRQMVELLCNGTFEDKDSNEAMEYLDLLVENAQNWDTTGTYEAPSKTQPYTSNGGPYCRTSNLHGVGWWFFFMCLLESVRWSRHLVIYWKPLGNRIYWSCQRFTGKGLVMVREVLAPLTHPTWGKLLRDFDVLKKF